MIWKIGIVLYAIWGLWYIYKKWKECEDAEKIAENWTKIAKAYPEDDFATINKAVKNLKKLGDNDKLILLLEVEKYLFGKTVYKDPYKAVELLKDVNKLPLPPKVAAQKRADKIKISKLKKQYEESIKKRKDVKKQMKKEAYIKKIKKAARENWNNFELWEIDHEIRRGNTSREGGV